MLTGKGKKDLLQLPELHALFSERCLFFPRDGKVENDIVKHPITFDDVEHLLVYDVCLLRSQSTICRRSTVILISNLAYRVTRLAIESRCFPIRRQLHVHSGQRTSHKKGHPCENVKPVLGIRAIVTTSNGDNEFGITMLMSTAASTAWTSSSGNPDPWRNARDLKRWFNRREANVRRNRILEQIQPAPIISSARRKFLRLI